MVTNINVGLDDDDAHRAQIVKEELGGTWPEVLMEMVELSELLLEAREEDYKPLPVVLEESLNQRTGGRAQAESAGGRAGADRAGGRAQSAAGGGRAGSREPPSEQSAGRSDAGIGEAPRNDEPASSASGSPPAHPRDSGGETQAEWVGYHLQREGVEFPQGKDRTDCELAVSAAFGYLANAGQATKGQIVLATMPENPLGYDVDGAREKVEAKGERFRGAWWRRVVKPGLEALPDVEKPSGGQSEWRYTGN
jgi:hypothetical protein